MIEQLLAPVVGAGITLLALIAARIAFAARDAVDPRVRRGPVAHKRNGGRKIR